MGSNSIKECLEPLWRICDRPNVVKGALRGALLYASATDIYPTKSVDSILLRGAYDNQTVSGRFGY